MTFDQQLHTLSKIDVQQVMSSCTLLSSEFFFVYTQKKRESERVVTYAPLPSGATVSVEVSWKTRGAARVARPLSVLMITIASLLSPTTPISGHAGLAELPQRWPLLNISLSWSSLYVR